MHALEERLMSRSEGSIGAPDPIDERGVERDIAALPLSADPETAAKVLEIHACRREMRWWARELRSGAKWLRGKYDATQKQFFLEDSIQLADALRVLDEIRSVAEFDDWLVDRREIFERVIIKDKNLWKEWMSRERE